MPSRPARRQSTLAALGLAIAVALVGAMLWGVVAMVSGRQLSLLGPLIGGGVGVAVARYRPGHPPTTIAGVLIAIAGCALGTFFAIVFSLLSEQVSMGTIASHLDAVFGIYSSEVGRLGLLFWLIAAVTAARLPLRGQRLYAQACGAGPAGPAGDADAVTAPEPAAPAAEPIISPEN